MGFVSYELYQSMKENCSGNFLDFDLSNVNCMNDLQVFENLVSGINRNQVLEPLCHKTFITSPTPKEMLKDRHRRSLAKLEEGFVAKKVHGYRASCSRAYTYVLLEYWANNDAVRKALHVREGTIKNWMRCNYDLSYEHEIDNVVEYHQNISTKGYRSLVYSGDHDMIVPHISTEAWIRTLTNLSVTEEWHPWFVDGQVAGYVNVDAGITHYMI
ncbi:hypothetical protein MKW94_012176 [Papaver nudicaule]|uniref:Serine carboxypeptidase n=1 Tax=Papaver nudicaule TaxID=74823 RepID=A0AA41VUI4_PAPNU|nr:hypothetical protein [Papaver nudicaule]